MKRMNLLLATLALVTAVAGCADGARTGESAAASTDVVCSPQGCISQSAFAANIANTLKNNVVGYEVLVGNTAPVGGGLARTTTDAPGGVAMSPAIQFDVASLSKIVTTVAVLRAMQQRSIGLDDSIVPYLPQVWQNNLGPNIGNITFRTLLEHRSGFRFSATDCCPAGNCTLPNNNTNFVNCHGNPTFANLQSLLQSGVSTAAQGTACYDNCNFAIFRDMFPAMEGLQYVNATTDGPEAQWDAAQYMSYVNQLVFAPIGIGTRECSPPSTAMYAYPFPANGAAGWNGGDETLTCGGSGWSLSSNDLMTLATELASGTTLLSPVQKSLMTNATQALGWDNTVRSDCPNGAAFCKNGLRPNNNAAFWSYMGVFQCSLPVVVAVNSTLPAAYQPVNGNGPDIVDLVANSFSAAKVAGTPVCCDGRPLCNGTCCGSGLVCDTAQTCAQCLPLQQACSGNADCCSGNCNGGVCSCASTDEACSTNGDCCSGNCSGGSCSCVPLGGLCNGVTCCGAAVCKSGVCTNYTPPSGCNGLRQPIGKCSAGWRCCGSDGWSCGVCK